MKHFIVVTALMSVMTSWAYAADLANGQKVFVSECAECHSLKAGKNKKGPSLFGVMGQAAARVPDFNYSEAMKASGWIWTADKFDAYVRAPKAALAGGKMKYEGLDNASQRSDLFAYLSTIK